MKLKVKVDDLNISLGPRKEIWNLKFSRCIINQTTQAEDLNYNSISSKYLNMKWNLIITYLIFGTNIIGHWCFGLATYSETKMLAEADAFVCPVSISVHPLLAIFTSFVHPWKWLEHHFLPSFVTFKSKTHPFPGVELTLRRNMGMGWRHSIKYLTLPTHSFSVGAIQHTF